MFEPERDLFEKEGIKIDSDFPYKYFDRYISVCNPSIKDHDELVQHLEELKKHVDPHTYEVAILFGATINLLRDYHYDFIVAMIKHKSFCDWICRLANEFESHKKEIEKWTNYDFN